MAVRSGPGGILVTAPDIVEVAFDEVPARQVSRGGPRGRGPVPIATPAAASLDAALLDALAKQNLSLAQTVHLRAGPAAAGRRSLPQAASARLTVPVGPEEDAVVLLEQAEVYSWSLPVARTEAAPGTRRAGVPTAQVAFDLPLGAVAPDRTDRRMLGGALLAPIRASVFRFVGRRLVDGAVRIQEHDVRPCLVRIAGRDPTSWVAGEPIVPAPPKAGTRHRILVLVHGTFSSTAGGFGQLGPTEWGGAFLDACGAYYDLVLGYDHRTLSESPAENAAALLDALRGLDWGEAGAPEIDLVAHSRGGLVARWLVEALTPASGWGAVYRRAILVGATNGGTELARPENWNAFLDLYTNLAVAACRALTFLPQAAPVATILAGTIATLGAFVKQIPLSGLDAAIAPGLFAMTPDNPFLKALNGLQAGQPAAADAIYHVVSSAFAPTLFGTDHQPKEFPLRLAQVLGGSAVTELMRGLENDLVVDTPSMSAIDAAFGDFVRDTLHFAASPLIYHTNYFSRPEVVNALTRWLALPRAEPPEEPGRRRRGRQSGRAAPLPELGSGQADVPASIETDILVMDPSRPAGTLLRELKAAAPSFVVLSARPHESSYAFDTAELIAAFGAAGNSPATEALALPERGADAVASVGEIARDTAAGIPVFRSGLGEAGDRPRRTIVTTEAGPIGVVPNASEIMINADIGTLSRNPPAADPALRRRSMPTFAQPSAAAPADSDAGQIECHFLAETAPKVRLGAALTVRVTVSREQIEAALGIEARGGTALDPGKPITIDVLPKRGFALAEDEEPVLMEPPKSNEPRELAFVLRAVGLGPGEIWVTAYQRKQLLLRLVLHPEVVTDDAQTADAHRLVSQASVAQIRGPEPTHTLKIFEQIARDGQGVTFRFDLDSPVLGVLGRYVSAPITGDRKAFAEGLYATIEGFWTGSERQANEFTEQLVDFGVRLLRQLVPQELQADLWKYRDSLDGIFVISEEPFIPWEMLFLVEPGKVVSDEGRFFAELGLVRWLYEARAAAPAELKVRKGRARYIIPDYPEVRNDDFNLYPLPEAQAEAAFLKVAFAATPVEANPAAVRTVLKGPNAFDLLHFAGHGAAARDIVDEAQVMLAGELTPQGYVAEYLKADHVEARAEFGTSRPVVTLNACQAGRADWKLTGMGGFAKAFLSRGAGAFIGTLWSVGDTPARVFTETFYEALKNGLTVSEAVREARATARSKADASWLAYAVYAHPGARLTLEGFGEV